MIHIIDIGTIDHEISCGSRSPVAVLELRPPLHRLVQEAGAAHSSGAPQEASAAAGDALRGRPAGAESEASRGEAGGRDSSHVAEIEDISHHTDV